jgi:hypothetical protein
VHLQRNQIIIEEAVRETGMCVCLRPHFSTDLDETLEINLEYYFN